MAHNFAYLSADEQQRLSAVARSVVPEGRGILAMDEPAEHIGGLLAKVGLENTAENRRQYRQTIFKADGIEKYVSAVILQSETAYQKTDEGLTFVEFLTKKGIAPGINVDLGLVPLQGTDNETTTQGLDNLIARARQFRKDGLVFAKFRASIDISANKPSHLAVTENANALARYASSCQQGGLVPIVEPDVSNAGTHSIEICKKTTEKVLSAVFKALSDHNVFLEGTLLKPNFVTPGLQGASKATAMQVGTATIEVFRRTVPAAVCGIAFLSGGISEDDSTAYLNAVNANKGNSTWALTFSFGRALQATAWQAYGKAQNSKAAQEAFLKRAQANSLASRGKA